VTPSDGAIEHGGIPPAEVAVDEGLVRGLHRPPPPGFPRNDYRGVPLAGLGGMVRQKLDTLENASTGLAVPAEAVWDRWQDAVSAPLDVADACIHGDLHPGNLVVDQGRLAAVLDWGDMTAGDSAADLAAAWPLFPVTAHAGVWTAYGRITAHTMARAAGWAVFFGVTLLANGLDSDPALAGIAAPR
jgi:aminoglycoside phosphotransferase (APT) family kinase protein